MVTNRHRTVGGARTGRPGTVTRMSRKPDKQIDRAPRGRGLRLAVLGALPTRRGRVAHALVVAVAYCAAVALLCSSTAVEYNQPAVGLGIGVLVVLHFPLGYLAQGRWTYPLCAFPAVWAVIARGDDLVGDITRYGFAFAFGWAVIGLPIALVVVALGRRMRPKL